MKPRIIKGSKQKIVEAIARMEGEVFEAIIFFSDPVEGDGSIFAEMEPFLTDAPCVDDSGESIYRRSEGE